MQLCKVIIMIANINFFHKENQLVLYKDTDFIITILR